MLMSSLWIELRIIIVLFGMLTIPGWALISITKIWECWKPLQRWCIAVGISIAFLPILYYWVRFLTPQIKIGSNKLLFLLLLLLVITILGIRKNWKEQFRFDQTELITLGIFGATIFTRFWVAHLHPYPAWTDSLHHTLLTQLTAQNGGLPYSMEPYEPVNLSMYHLGLYGLTAMTQLLAKVPAHTALLWTVQALNGLCVAGVFLILDKKVGRIGALAGCLVVGLLSFQPAWYVNWGRFTQVSSQAILLIAWIVTWEALRAWSKFGNIPFREILGLTIAGALLNGGVFLLHFRVSGYYLPLLLITVVYEIYRSFQSNKMIKFFVGTLATGILSVIIIMPALVIAISTYILGRTKNASDTSLADSSYYSGTTLRTFFEIGIHPWLFTLLIVSILFLVYRKNRFSLFIFSWVIILIGIGNAYRFNIPLLAFSNDTAIIIMLYLPVSLLVGAAIEELILLIPQLRMESLKSILVTCLVVFVFLGSHFRVSDIENYRYFLSDDDIAAMGWIRENTPSDAVFAINTTMWLNSYPHGMDGGYWIPYFTGRKTNTGSMLFGLGNLDYQLKTRLISDDIVGVAEGKIKIDELCTRDIDYFYLTNKFINQNILDIVKKNSNINVVYQQQTVVILLICNN